MPGSYKHFVKIIAISHHLRLSLRLLSMEIYGEALFIVGLTVAVDHPQAFEAYAPWSMMVGSLGLNEIILSAYYTVIKSVICVSVTGEVL